MFVPPHLLIHLPYLAQVARFNSFTKAAEALHVTQAAVSYQVKQLEDKTGCMLVLRQSGGKTRLTEAGKQLIAEFTRCDKRLRLALERLNYTDGAGVLRITTPVDFGSLVMPKIIAQLQKSAPQLEIHCHTSDVVVDLASSEWDMAISFVDYDVPDPPGILYSSQLKLVASREYLSTFGRPKNAVDLRSHRLLTRYASTNRSWKKLLTTVDETVEPITGFQNLGNTFALLEAAKCGLGIALLPEFCSAEAVRTGKLQFVCEKITLPLARFCLRKIVSPQMVYFEEILKAAIKKYLENT